MTERRPTQADLKAAKWRAFTDNFLPVALSSGYAAQLNWFDDERWRIIVNNFGVVAQIAAEGGVKGLIIDPEDYSYMLFKYLDQQQLLDRSLEAYMAMVRQRAANKFNVQSTPTFFVNGKQLRGSATLAEFEKEMAPYLKE